MSVFNINTNSILEQDFSQHLDYNPDLKDKYGEVNTPFPFINKMLSIIPKECFENKNYKWLDAGAGHGNYSLCLFFILFISLYKSIPDEKERKIHIIENMIYMIEVNKENILHLREKFGNKSNIINTDYLEWETDIKFDFIIGNPPYNCNGVKKVPTNTNVSKKQMEKRFGANLLKRTFIS